MKKKLSLLLASMLVATMVPVSSFAAERYNVVEEGTTTPVSYNAEFEVGGVAITSDKTIELTVDNGAELLSVTTGGVTSLGTATLVAGKAYVDVTEDIQANATLNLGVSVDVEDVEAGKDVTLNVKVNGIATPYLVAKVVAKESTALAIKVDNEKDTISRDGGSLSKFEVTGYDDTKDMTIKLENEDFDLSGATLSGLAVGDVSTSGEITITSAQLATAYTVYVNPHDVTVYNKAEFGPVYVEVTQGNKTVRAQIGEYVDYGATISAKEPGKKVIPTIEAGENGTVTVTIDATAGTLMRELDFEIDGASFPAVTTGTTASNQSGAFSSTSGMASVEGLAKNVDDGISEFTIDPVDNTTKVEFTIDTLNIDADAPAGKVTLTVSGRDLEENLVVDIAEVVRKYDVSTTVTEIKRGESVETSDIVIKVAEDSPLKVGQSVKVVFNDKIAANNKGTFEGTNGIQFGDVKWSKDVNGNTIGFETEVKATSKGKEAEIVISDIATDMLFNAVHNRTYDVTVYINGKDYATVDYAKCVAEYAIRKPQVVFTLGSADYTVNGVKYTLEAPVFTKDDRTMLPVGPLGLALGLDVSYNESTQTATFIDRDTNLIVTIKEGASVLYMNGVEMPMTTSAITVNGRIFVPVSSVTQAFGLPIAWDAATSTVTVN